MYLFILESIGTQELILIAGIALIIFGPRKLPQIAKTIGKTMAEFRNATTEFKNTWEKEVAFEEDDKILDNKIISTAENSIARDIKPEEIDAGVLMTANPPTPEIKELSSEDVARIFQNKENQLQEAQVKESKIEPISTAKRDWL